jgi:hypothetical protein
VSPHIQPMERSPWNSVLVAQAEKDRRESLGLCGAPHGCLPCSSPRRPPLASSKPSSTSIQPASSHDLRILIARSREGKRQHPRVTLDVDSNVDLLMLTGHIKTFSPYHSIQSPTCFKKVCPNLPPCLWLHLRGGLRVLSPVRWASWKSITSFNECLINV